METKISSLPNINIKASKDKTPTIYRCSVCGVPVESYDGQKPKTCPKCDNNKFYRSEK